MMRGREKIVREKKEKEDGRQEAYWWRWCNSLLFGSSWCIDMSICSTTWEEQKRPNVLSCNSKFIRIRWDVITLSGGTERRRRWRAEKRVKMKGEKKNHYPKLRNLRLQEKEKKRKLRKLMVVGIRSGGGETRETIERSSWIPLLILYQVLPTSTEQYNSCSLLSLDWLLVLSLLWMILSWFRRREKRLVALVFFLSTLDEKDDDGIHSTGYLHINLDLFLPPSLSHPSHSYFIFFPHFLSSCHSN